MKKIIAIVSMYYGISALPSYKHIMSIYSIGIWESRDYVNVEGWWYAVGTDMHAHSIRK